MGARARSISYVTSWGHVIPRLSKLKRKENKPRDFVSPILPITMALAALGMVNVGGGVTPGPPTLPRKSKEAKFEPCLPGCSEGILVNLGG